MFLQKAGATNWVCGVWKKRVGRQSLVKDVNQMGTVGSSVLELVRASLSLLHQF